jgi:hypothetical protein
VQAQHRAQEIVAALRVNPPRAQDQCIRRGLPYGPFPGQLAAPVNAERCGRRILRIGTAARTVEHEIRGHVQQADAALGARCGQQTRCGRVRRQRRFRLALGAIHGGVGGGVDEQRRTLFIEQRAQRGRVADIAGGAVQAMAVKVAGAVCSSACPSWPAAPVTIARGVSGSTTRQSCTIRASSQSPRSPST